MRSGHFRNVRNADHRTDEVLRSPDSGVESRRQPDTVAVSPPDPTAPPRQPDDLFGPELA
jgi:hypothetical protein